MAEKSNAIADYRQKMKLKFKNDSTLNTFSEQEVLEMALFYCCSKENTAELSHKLINRFGSIYGVFSASEDELKDSGLLNEAAVSKLKFLFALTGYLQRIHGKAKNCDTNSDELESYIGATFAGLETEALILFFVDSALKVKKQVTASIGDFGSVHADLRNLTKLVLNSGYDSVIISHNHPNFIAEPSDMDIMLTKRIEQFWETLNIKLVDHYIVGCDKVVSMRSLGLF